MRFHPIRILSIALAATALAACQGMPSEHHEHHADLVMHEGDVDRQFLDQMSQHHAGAIAIGQIAERQGSTAHVKSMGTSLIANQKQGLDRMQGWRNQWYGPGPVLAAQDEDRRSADELSRLSGVEFDKAFANKVIAHHQEGIKMATPAANHAAHPEIASFAKQLIEDENHQIEHLKEHLREWGGTPQ